MPNNDPITRIYATTKDQVYEQGDPIDGVDVIFRKDQGLLKLIIGGKVMPIIDLNGNFVGGVKKVSASLSRSSAAISGAQAVTGLGFTPTMIHFIGTDDQASANRSMGWSDGIVHACVAGLGGNITKALDIVGSGNGWQFTVQSMDPDGFTLDWTKIGNGLNVTVKYIAIK